MTSFDSTKRQTMLKTETLDACPTCDGRDLRPLLNVAPDFESATGDYGVLECVRCGMGFTSPRPLESELPALYATRTTADFPPNQGVVGKLRDWKIDSYIRTCLTPQDALSILDFGCGDGAVSRGALRYVPSARVTAVDFHSDAPVAFRSAGIRYMNYDDWRGTEEKYDAIFLRHVLEHHPDPRRLLGELRRVLKSDGRLYIEVPNRTSTWARVFGRYYCGYYIPRHLMHFTLDALRLAVENSGLRCVKSGLGHTPLLGRSIGYLSRTDIGNLGLIGLATYPVQVAGDVLTMSSSTLRVTATPAG